MSLEINKIKPDTIFAPYLHDAHSDHFFTTYALNHILKAFRYPFLKDVIYMRHCQKQTKAL